MWCRRTDELVDGPNASHITPQALDRWEARLEDIFNGRPFDMLDAALSDTVSRFPVDIQVNLSKWITIIFARFRCYSLLLSAFPMQVLIEFDILFFFVSLSLSLITFTYICYLISKLGN